MKESPLRLHRGWSLLIIFAASALYALSMRVLFGWEAVEDWLPIVSLSFLFLLPVAVGGLITFLGIRLFGRSGFWIFWAPILTMLVGILVAGLTELEAVLCLVVGVPVMLPLAVVGGWIVSLIMKKSDGRLQVSLLALLPLLIAPLEARWERPHRLLTVSDHIDIDAESAVIWREIVSVAPIDRAELPRQWIYLLDFPRPISAEIDREALGGRRLALFERGVTFFEVVTEWKEGETLAFSIEADPDFIPHTAFDQHIVVGGRFYDVLDGRYEIEPLAGGGCRLHLTSTHRLSTPLNAYAGWWSEWVMRQIQGSILVVIRNRCESQ